MDIKKYIYGHCVYPQKLSVFDPITKGYVVREVPCGKCLHCKNTAINEWVTRLYAESMHRPYVYYVTLDYSPFSYEKDTFSDPVAARLAADTAACWHNININRRYGMHPLLLRKSHLQNFFKRLRKNESVKFSYFACGEYGMHANGRGFGRPHFHIIFFADEVMTPGMINRAWTLDGYKIGKVDFNDLRANGSFKEININTKNSSKYVFKYVCKYLQKSDFNFEKLATIDFHRAYFKALCSTTLFPELASESEFASNYTWDAYCKDYSPFVVCSRRPSLGLGYFQANCERFKKRDFRLFGLSEDCVAFPRYYLRKTKELLCPFQTIGSESGSPASSSRFGVLLSVLREIQVHRLDFGSFGDSFSSSWDISRSCVPTRKKVDPFKTTYRFGKKEVLLSDLHIYDMQNRIFYQFNGYSYTLWKRIHKLGYVRVGYADISDILNRCGPVYDNYYDNFLVPLERLRVLHEKDLQDTIDILYNGTEREKYDAFRRDVDAAYQTELDTHYKHTLLTQNSKLFL